MSNKINLLELAQQSRLQLQTLSEMANIPDWVNPSIYNYLRALKEDERWHFSYQYDADYEAVYYIWSFDGYLDSSINGTRIWLRHSLDMDEGQYEVYMSKHPISLVPISYMMKTYPIAHANSLVMAVRKVLELMDRKGS